MRIEGREDERGAERDEGRELGRLEGRDGETEGGEEFT